MNDETLSVGHERQRSSSFALKINGWNSAQTPTDFAGSFPAVFEHPALMAAAIFFHYET